MQISPRTSKLINPIQELDTLVRIRSKARHVTYLSTVDDEVAGWDQLGSRKHWLGTTQPGMIDIVQQRDPT